MNNVASLTQANNPCTGCGICSVICPEKCITIKPNESGFYEPILNNEKCSGCGLCLKVCYKTFDINSPKGGYELEQGVVYSAILKNKEKLMASTSGGVAGEIAEHGFKKGYQIVGAVMDLQHNNAKHIIATNQSDLNQIRGSKYVQSNIWEAVSNLNLDGKMIIFGLPCQIYGIRNYMQIIGTEDKAILVDLFCRGIPTLHLFRKYREYLTEEFGLDMLTDINFRSKRNGWHKFMVVIKDRNGLEYTGSVFDDIFFSFYLKNTCFRESCYSCEFRHNRVYSDIRLGDFWGPRFLHNEEGVSIVTLYTDAGIRLWKEIAEQFDIEAYEASELKISQRFNKYAIPDYREKCLLALKSEESLNLIHKRLGLDKIGFYNERKQ